MKQKAHSVKGNRHKLTLIILVGIIAMAVGITISTFKYSNASMANNSDLQATLLQTPRQINQFELIDNENTPFTNENLANHWTMMFFGYTNCPDICPIIMAELKKMDITLNQSNSKILPQVVMVSVDPQRDTPATLNRYVKSFNESFIGATADQDQIDKLAKELGIAYMRVEQNHDHHHGAMDYQVDHSGTIVLVNPDGDLAGYFTMPVNGDTLAHDFQAITR